MALARCALWVSLVLLAACADGEMTSGAPDELTLPPVPARGFQIVLPPLENIEPGGSYEMCTWTERILDEQVDLRGLQGHQTATGHHVVLYTTQVHKPAGTTRPCTDEDMLTFRYVAVGGGEGSEWFNEAPGELVYRLPKGSQLVLNHHYLNATQRTLRARSAMTFYPAEEGRRYTPAGSLAFVDTAMQLPAGAAQLDIDCTLAESFSGWLMYPHMHRWGQHIRMEHQGPAGSEVLFDVAWRDGYDFHPPMIYRDPAAPLRFEKGDRVRVRCEWQLPRPMGFGLEMCVIFMSTIDDRGRGNVKCDGGRWGAF